MTNQPNPTKGTASVVHFYSGDGGIALLAQNLGVKLSNFVTGYGASILLIEESWSAKLFSGTALEEATEVREPTAANFIGAIKDLIEDSYSVDVFVHGHGDTGLISVSKGFSRDSWLLESELDENLLNARKDLGLTTLPIRLVAQWNCFASAMNDTWTKQGAKCAFGARGVMYYPQQCNNFATAWNDGVTVKTAVADALDDSIRTTTQTFLLLQAANPFDKEKWGGCPLLPEPKTILSDHDCARAFFNWKFGVSSSDWPSGMSGAEYMDYASTLLLEGSTSITKNTKPTW